MTSTVTVPPRVNEINREKVCPLLLRVFPKVGVHHQVSEYAKGKEPTEDEVQIYTWKDATLRELTELIKAVNAAARRRDSRLSFAFVYPDRRGRNVMREVGMVMSTRKGEDDNKTLSQLQFETGKQPSILPFYSISQI